MAGGVKVEPILDGETAESNSATVFPAVHSLTPGHESGTLTPEQQRADNILREERFRLLVQGVTDYAIFLLDAQGRILCWNTGAMLIFGYDETEAIGRPYSLIFTAEDIRDGVPAGELTRAAIHKTARDDGWHVRKGGGRFRVRGTVTAIRDKDGTLIGYAKVVHDLKDEEVAGELRAWGTKLAEADKRKDEFLAMLSHELRNPLAPLLNALHLLREDSSMDDRSRGQAISIVERQVRQMAHLVDDLLDLSRIKSGKIQLRVEQFDLCAIIGRAIDSARPFAESRRHRLVSSLPREAVCVEADPARLEQVFTNLLNNAVKYTDQGGQVEVELQRQGAQAFIQVRDNGVGISAEMLPHIFDLFTQSERSLDRSQGGLGIGLSVVREIIALHRGTVAAASDGLGKGSVFLVQIPVSTTATSGTPDLQPESHHGLTARLRIMVVDDNVDAAETLAQLLRHFGHDVRVATDGPGAVILAVAFHPHAVFLDIGLPGMDGHAVAQRLREHDPNVHVAALSGYTEQEATRQYGGALAFDEYFVKPADPEAIRDLLQAIGALAAR